MIKKGEIERTLVRLYYLALANVPINFIEETFARKFGKFKKFTCIDDIFEVLDTERWKILQKNEVKIYKYIENPPFSERPYVRGEVFNQMRMEEYLNELFQKIKRKYEDKDKKAQKLMVEFRIVKSPKEPVPIEGLKQSNIFRALLFRNDPMEVRKGTNILICMLTLWGIKNGDIYGDGTDHLEQIVKVFVCLSRKTEIDPNKAWQLLNEVLGTDYEYTFDCSTYQV